MDEMLKTLRTANASTGPGPRLYPGLSESEEIQTRRANGIPLHKEVLQWFTECTSRAGHCASGSKSLNRKSVAAQTGGSDMAKGTLIAAQ